jgi:hypothetical protein
LQNNTFLKKAFSILLTVIKLLDYCYTSNQFFFEKAQSIDLQYPGKLDIENFISSLYSSILFSCICIALEVMQCPNNRAMHYFTLHGYHHHCSNDSVVVVVVSVVVVVVTYSSFLTTKKILFVYCSYALKQSVQYQNSSYITSYSIGFIFFSLYSHLKTKFKG